MRRAAPWVLLAVLASAGAARAQDLRTAADYLKRIDCDMGQGYLFSHPLPADELVAFIRQRNACRREI